MLEMIGSKEWAEYFRGNGGERAIPWERAGALTGRERKMIARSVQEFQLGESGEGKHIFKQARKWAARSGDGEYLGALRLFIAEEIRHSRELGRFMEIVGIEKTRTTWMDSLFRWTRSRAGLELTIAVLVAAEIMAKVYYAGLRDATGNGALRHICGLILRDEVEHVRFQCQRLAILRERKSWWGLWWRKGLMKFFFSGMVTAVWLGRHGGVMRAGGWSWRRYWRGCAAELKEAMEIADPRAYARGTEIERVAARA